MEGMWRDGENTGRDVLDAVTSLSDHTAVRLCHAG